MACDFIFPHTRRPSSGVWNSFASIFCYSAKLYKVTSTSEVSRVVNVHHPKFVAQLRQQSLISGKSCSMYQEQLDVTIEQSDEVYRLLLRISIQHICMKVEAPACKRIKTRFPSRMIAICQIELGHYESQNTSYLLAICQRTGFLRASRQWWCKLWNSVCILLALLQFSLLLEYEKSTSNKVT